MPPPSQAAIEAFEQQYEIEFKRYQEENLNDSVWNTIQRYPLKNFILIILLLRSCHSFQHAVLQLRPMQLVVAFVLGYFVADFLTGLLHLVCDNTPLSLRTIYSGRPPWEWAAYGFHYHHINPTDWNHNNIYFGAVVRAGFLFYVPLTLMTLPLHSRPFLRVALLVCAHTGVLAQYTHAASHGRFHSNKMVRWLQDYGIILHPDTHKIHHQQFDQNYAILNGWSNGLLNWIYRHWVAPYTPESVSAATQKQLYHDKEVKTGVNEVFRVKSIQHQYVIFPEYRKHKGCPI